MFQKENWCMQVSGPCFSRPIGVCSYVWFFREEQEAHKWASHVSRRKWGRASGESWFTQIRRIVIFSWMKCETNHGGCRPRQVFLKTRARSAKARLQDGPKASPRSAQDLSRHAQKNTQEAPRTSNPKVPNLWRGGTRAKLLSILLNSYI